jgi:hypothetical protein
MITEIPMPEDFYDAGLDSLHLAWKIAMDSISQFISMKQLWQDIDEDSVDAEAYYQKSQPALSNAYSLVQQAGEMAVKGRIARVSPFLLIGRDPKDWPKGYSNKDVPFSQFRTLDAADLVKVNNAVAEQKLDDEFANFWDQLRRDRNTIMHAVTARNISPEILVRAILTVAKVLFDDESWVSKLFKIQSDGTAESFGYHDDYTQNIIMHEVEMAVSQLGPSDAQKYLGFSKGSRAYLCPNCLQNADTEIDGDLPKLAQLVSRQSNETRIHCVVCEKSTIVERAKCFRPNPNCEANVIHDNRCLSCNWEQDCPCHFHSGLSFDESQTGQRYDFSFKRASETSLDCLHFPNDDAAIEHARLTMAASHLSSWTAVEVKIEPYLGMRTLDPHRKTKILGCWIRSGENLEWQSGMEVVEMEL